MPVISVEDPRSQELLRETRRLLSPRDAADALAVSRQALDKAVERPEGPYLVWRFVVPQRRHVRWVDFGAVNEPPDPSAWADQGDDPSFLAKPAPPAASDPNAADAEVALSLVASGIVQLADERSKRRTVLPYPVPLQRALDRLTVLAWKLRRKPPMGVPDLLSWASGPVPQWLPEIPPQIAGDADVLVVNGMPTTYCREWAVDAVDVEGEVVETRLLRSALAICRQRGDQNAYESFRRLLIERPVLGAIDLLQYSSEPQLRPLASILRESYVPVPPEHAFGGFAEVCACSHLVVRHLHGRGCSNDRCDHADGAEPARRISMAHEPVWLRPPVRTFVSLPGIAELRIAARVQELGLSVRLWPAFDSYDLRIEFADGAAWAIDVKDWASPVALARHLSSVGQPFRYDPPWQRALFAFPRARTHRRPEYLRVFRHFFRSDQAHVGVVTEDALLRQVARRAQGEAPSA